MTSKSQEIKDTITAIRNESHSSSEKALKNKYYSFYEKYPKLFNVATNTSFPLTYLDMMLAELDNLDTQKVDMDTADKNIYGHLRSIYVDPMIKIPEGAITQGPAAAATATSQPSEAPPS